MRTSLAALAACSLIATVATAGAAPATAASGCTEPTQIVSSSISPKTVVLGVSQPKGIVISTKIRSNGCTVDRVEMGLYGPNFVDTYELDAVGTSKGVTTYDKGLRIAPGDLGNSEAGKWSSYVSVWGQKSAEAPGPSFQILRAARLTTNASPEPVKKGRTITVQGSLKRADWNTVSYRGYSGRKVELQWRSATGAYAKIKTVKSGTDGVLRSTVKATKDGCFRYVFKGSPTTARVTSATDCITVK